PCFTVWVLDIANDADYFTSMRRLASQDVRDATRVPRNRVCSMQLPDSADMLSIRESQMNKMAEETASEQMIQPCDNTRTWIEIRLIDKDGDPVPGERYRLRLPDYAIMEGVLDEEGKARYDGILPGTCLVQFPGLDAKEWRPV